jgi:hypothetical protein
LYTYHTIQTKTQFVLSRLEMVVNDNISQQLYQGPGELLLKQVALCWDHINLLSLHQEIVPLLLILFVLLLLQLAFVFRWKFPAMGNYCRQFQLNKNNHFHSTSHASYPRHTSASSRFVSSHFLLKVTALLFISFQLRGISIYIQ